MTAEACYTCQYRYATQDGGYECDPPMGECPLDRPEPEDTPDILTYESTGIARPE